MTGPQQSIPQRYGLDQPAPAQNTHVTTETLMHDLVRIEWHDSRGATSRWQHIEDLDEGACHMQSVGWIVRQTDEFVVLAPHMSADCEQASGVMYIPKSAITMTHHISRKLKAVAA